MDLLSSAYADDDEEDEDNNNGSNSDHSIVRPTASPQHLNFTKRPRLQQQYYHPYHNHPPPPDPTTRPAAVPSSFTGRYVSKRERAAIATAAAAANSTAAVTQPSQLPTVFPSPVVGSISDSDLPHNIAASLKYRQKVFAKYNEASEACPVALNGHKKAVNSIQWSRSHGHLLASAGMDETLRVWNVWSKGQKVARVLKNHTAAVKDVRWSQEGLNILSCGYDCSSRLLDVEKGMETQQFKEDQIVEVIKFHPRESNLFVSGGSKGSLKLWDIRIGKVVNEFRRDLGPILDIEFSLDGKHLISSSDTTKSRISENSIVVWDVSRQIPLSKQVYAEAYTCPCIRYHPSEASFIGQSNGNYIARFSALPPFKLDKYKRYEMHGVWGFPVKCNFSLDGEEIASGSSDGFIYFYNYRSSVLSRKVRAFDQPCIDVAFHPVMLNVIASCSWAGEISVFQ